MGTHLVEPGAVLADRYVLEDLVAQDAGSESWRARDKILARSVVLQLLPSSSPRATSLLAAAKQASRITDTRILQVLDAVDDGELSYIVREWASGQSLDVMLTEGPLAARRAAWLLREVAGAILSAHRMGIPHRRLFPDSVVITKSSGVKLIGVGTAAALREGDDEVLDSAEAERADTQDLGRLLYACLTARWPGEGWAGLPTAPTEHGRLLRPRQVRAGVPRALDAICDRILGTNSRYGPPITTVEEVKENLGRVLAEEGFTSTNGSSIPPVTGGVMPTRREPPPAVLRRDDEDATGEQPAYVEPLPTEGSSIGRTLTWTVVIALVLGAILLGYLIGQQGTNKSEDPLRGNGPGSSQTAQQNLRPIEVSSATSFDPVGDNGSGDEYPDLAPLAIDGNNATSWHTQTYYDDPKLGGQKPGVGLVLDLGSVQSVGAVKVNVSGGPTTVEIRAAADSASSMPTDGVAQYALAGSSEGVDGEGTITLNRAVNTRYLLVYLTSLPETDPGDFVGTINEIQVLG